MILENLNKYITFKKIPIYKFEEELGLGRGTVSKAIKKNGGISTGILENILKKYSDINFEWLVTGKGKMLKKETSNDTKKEYPEIPIFNLEKMNSLSKILDKENKKAIDGLVKLPNTLNCDGAVYLKGDNMSPLLRNGDMVLFKKVDKSNIFYGEIYLLSISLNEKEEYISIKFINKSDKGSDWIKLVSENSRYEDQDIKLDEINSLALVRTTVRNNN